MPRIYPYPEERDLNPVYVPNHTWGIEGSHAMDLPVAIRTLQAMSWSKRRHFLMQIISCANPRREVFHLGQSVMYAKTIEWLLRREIIRSRTPEDQKDKAYVPTMTGRWLLWHFQAEVEAIWIQWHGTLDGLDFIPE